MDAIPPSPFLSFYRIAVSNALRKYVLVNLRIEKQSFVMHFRADPLCNQVGNGYIGGPVEEGECNQHQSASNVKLEVRIKYVRDDNNRPILPAALMWKTQSVGRRLLGEATCLNSPRVG